MKVDNPSSSIAPIPPVREAQGRLCAEDAFPPSPPSPVPSNNPVSSNPFGINVVVSFVSDSRGDPGKRVGSPNGSGSSVVIFNGGYVVGDGHCPVLGATRRDGFLGIRRLRSQRRSTIEARDGMWLLLGDLTPYLPYVQGRAEDGLACSLTRIPPSRLRGAHQFL